MRLLIALMLVAVASASLSPLQSTKAMSAAKIDCNIQPCEQIQLAPNTPSCAPAVQAVTCCQTPQSTCCNQQVTCSAVPQNNVQLVPAGTIKTQTSCCTPTITVGCVTCSSGMRFAEVESQAETHVEAQAGTEQCPQTVQVVTCCPQNAPPTACCNQAKPCTYIGQMVMGKLQSNTCATPVTS